MDTSRAQLTESFNKELEKLELDSIANNSANPLLKQLNSYLFILFLAGVNHGVEIARQIQQENEYKLMNSFVSLYGSK